MSKRRLQKRTRGLAWEDLRCVLAIARTGSLSGAARALDVRHSTVFRRLNAIERRLAIKLFERTRAGYTVTASGEHAVAAASAMEVEALAVERRMLGAANRLGGVVRLATSELLAGLLSPEVLQSFLTTHPQIEVEIDVSSRAVDLTRREADLALRATNVPPEDLIGRQLGELRYAVYGTRDYAGAPSVTALDAAAWLGFDRSLAYLEIARWQKAQIPERSVTPILDQPRMKVWVLSHGDTRENARVRAFTQHLGRHVHRVLAARQPS